MFVTGKLGTTTTNYVTQAAYWPQGALYYFTRGNGVWHAEGYNNRLQPTEFYEAVNNSTANLLSGFLPELGRAAELRCCAVRVVPGN